MNSQQTAQEKSSFIFNLEVLIEDVHHAAALEKLIHGMNQGEFLDYRILSGVQLGKLIDQKKSIPATIHAVPVQPADPASSLPDINSAPAEPVSPAAADPQIPNDVLQKVQLFMSNNTLVRLFINKGLGIKKSIPCRIIRMDQEQQLITVYHVDEKQVYTFHHYEIEDIV
ncbi:MULTISPECIES: hypothetical protein [unclassified Paenibacillus]|uniref:hypothetical protein n=1 Tax=unclassified Paenibacillus TaxID=185978 RepID=UPI002F3F2CFE